MARFHGDLPKRTYEFALAVMSLCDGLPHATAGWVISRQLLRSGTGVGANIREADSALTEREFIQFCNITRRESVETHYWLSLCRDRNLLVGPKLEPAIIESDEIARVLATIVRKTRAKLESQATA